MPIPGPIEIGVFRDLVAYMKISHQRLVNIQSPWAEMLGDFMDVLDGVVNPGGGA